MNVQSQLLLLGVLPDTKIMVAERKRVRGLVSTPAHPKVSLSRPTATGGDEEMLTQNYSSEEIILMWSKTAVRDDRLAMWPAGKG
ncbi:hypothetical protein AC058_01085 [Acinetobacter genomosp. 33YU]|uniref:Uncharacterized protein n=1 Tax=Acinetobacter genomosp. 33YU TaxID=1675530 RepID=A0A1V2V217_9GAMM|nr:hypothetical protein AC058_01085 [Acinetobacter genomosp. 33YU]